MVWVVLFEFDVDWLIMVCILLMSRFVGVWLVMNSGMVMFFVYVVV